MNTCTTCGATDAGSSRYCPRCGRPFESDHGAFVVTPIELTPTVDSISATPLGGGATTQAAAPSGNNDPLARATPHPERAPAPPGVASIPPAAPMETERRRRRAWRGRSAVGMVVGLPPLTLYSLGLAHAYRIDRASDLGVLLSTAFLNASAAACLVYVVEAVAGLVCAALPRRRAVGFGLLTMLVLTPLLALLIPLVAQSVAPS